MMRKLLAYSTLGLGYAGFVGVVGSLALAKDCIDIRDYITELKKSEIPQTEHIREMNSTLDKLPTPSGCYTLAGLSLLPTLVGGKLYSMLAEDSRNRR